MSRYSKQIKDDISRKLDNGKIKILDLETESSIIDAFVGDRKSWKREWLKYDFSPSTNLQDCVDLIEFVFKTAEWHIECLSREDGDYLAYVDDEDYMVVSFSPARALLLAAWNAWRIKNDTPLE